MQGVPGVLMPPLQHQQPCERRGRDWGRPAAGLVRPSARKRR
jgi:hypothetical protein